MIDRLKIVDCNRKAILGLPDGEYKLWWCYYMNEDVEQESWLSQDEIAKQTGQSVTSILRHTTSLLKSGWLVDTGKTAADKWKTLGKTASKGSHQIKVYRVDDPTPKVSPVNLVGVNDPPSNCTPVKLVDKVYYYGSGSGYGSNSSSSSPLDVELHDNYPVAAEEPKGEDENQKPKTKTKGVGRKRKPAQDGTPYPPQFNTWSLAKRLAWSDEHNKPVAVAAPPVDLDTLDDEPRELYLTPGDPDYDPDFGPSPPKEKATPNPKTLDMPPVAAAPPKLCRCGHPIEGDGMGQLCNLCFISLWESRQVR